MIGFSTYCKIKDLRQFEHLSLRETARRLHVDRRTVKKYDQMDHYEVPVRQKSNDLLEGFRRAIIDELAIAQSSASTIFQSLQTQGYKGGYTSVRKFVAQLRPLCDENGPVLLGRWILMLLQGAITPDNVSLALGQKISDEDVSGLVSAVRDGCLRKRNYALSILLYFRGISIRQISKLLAMNRNTATEAIKRFCDGGLVELSNPRKRLTPKKHEQQEYKDALFKILHSPPREHGINRTAWTMKDLHIAMADEGFPIAMDSIRMILKAAGFRFKKAKRVLTSTDPNYRNKLASITGILSQLGEDERFFSIDEFGPVSIKIHAGTALTGPGEERTVPQIQKSKGRVMLVAALELATNQITHFYANRKSTDEMIQLLYLLLGQYSEFGRIYLSWDDASWHSSKRFIAEVDSVNSKEYRSKFGTPEVALAPLPSCAQFLNVIESVFSGMARAIIHNSDYDSVEQCKYYINRYLNERNEHYLVHPKRAGKKIWGQEREFPVFRESNNCKDPLY